MPESDDRTYVRIGAEVFDPDRATRRCELEPVETSTGVRVNPSELKIEASSPRWLAGFYSLSGAPVAGKPQQCVVWDTLSGRHTQLGEPHWADDPFGSRLCLLKGDRLFILDHLHRSPDDADQIIRSELWDLSKMTLIRRLDEKPDQPSALGLIAAWSDDVGVSMILSPGGATEVGRPKAYQRWAWADGGVENIPGWLGLRELNR